MMTSAANLDWLMDLFAADNHDAFIAEALAAAPSSLLFLPYLQGERAPFNDPLARGAFIGLSRLSDRAELARALLEGLVFAYRHTLSALSPQPPQSLTLIGGGARNALLNQLFADILGLPVRIPPEAEQAGLYGALRAAQVVLGHNDDYSIPPAPGTIILAPKLQHAARHDWQYENYLAAYQALRPLFPAPGRGLTASEPPARICVYVHLLCKCTD